MVKGQVLGILGHSLHLGYCWQVSPMEGCSVPGVGRVYLAKGPSRHICIVCVGPVVHSVRFSCQCVLVRGGP